MLGTPGNPIITETWQLVAVIVAGILVVAFLNRVIRRRVARDRDRDVRGD